MNRRVFRFVLMLAVLLIVMTGRVMGQGKELAADIPFNFTVCNQEMPAGKYKVQPLTTATTSLMLVHSEDGRSAGIACMHAVQSSTGPAEGKMIFNRYGNQYFLAELWFPGELSGNQAFKSEREEALIRELQPKTRGRVTIRVTEIRPN